MPDSPDLARVVEAVREAAAEAIRRDAATVRVSSVAELYGPDHTYDAPVVVLTPRNPNAAEVRVELQEGVWWLVAGDGPPYEFWGDQREWIGSLRAIVGAVVAGRYDVTSGRWGRRRGHETATFWTSEGPIETRHHRRRPPAEGTTMRRFAPY